jgi:hypothetical protein
MRSFSENTWLSICAMCGEKEIQINQSFLKKVAKFPSYVILMLM